MRRSSRSAANSAMKRSKARTAPKEPKGFWNAVGNGAHRFADYVRSFERSLLIRAILVGVGTWSFVVLIETYNAFQEDRVFKTQERENWRMDRIDRAWNRVLRTVTGNTAKGEALSHLYDQRRNLENVDLSCKTMGGFIDNKCLRLVTITDLKFINFRPITPRQRFINAHNSMAGPAVKIDFSGAIIKGLSLKNESAAFQLDDAILNFATITDAGLRIMGEAQTTVIHSNLSNSTLHFSTKMKISSSNISGTRFIPKKDLEFTGENFDMGNWFWVDNPPTCGISKSRGIKLDACKFVYLKRVLICANLTPKQEQMRALKFPKGREKNFEKVTSIKYGFHCSQRIAGRPLHNEGNIVRFLTKPQAAFLYPEIYDAKLAPSL